MKHIIELMPYPLTQMGGIESHVRELTKALQLQIGTGDAEVSLAYRPARGTWATIQAADMLAFHGGAGSAKPLPDAAHDQASRRSDAVGTICSADVLHLHGLARLPYLSLLRRVSAKSTVVLTTHGSFWSESEHVAGALSHARNLFDRAFATEFLARCTAILVASQAEYEVMVTSTIAKHHRERIHVLPLPVAATERVSHLTGTARSDARLVALGRQDRLKGFELLAETILANPDLPACDIVGPRGNSTRRLERILASDVSGRVRLRPTVYGAAERTKLLCSALAVVVPSQFESFSLVAHEAILADTPVVISDSAAQAVPRAAVHVFRTGDSASLACALRWVSAHGRSEAARAARAEARLLMHSYASYATEVLKLYDVPLRRAGSRQ